MKHLRPVLVALLAMSPLSIAQEPTSPAGAREAWNRPVPEWREGPVRYALTDKETREYRSLGTAAERAAFLARFWAARDPSPFTPGNEAEETFWARVAAANQLFTDTTISGWRTDRGRVYIVLGPPDEIASYPVPSVEELDRSHFPDPHQRWGKGELRPGMRGAVEWVYRSLESSRADTWQKVTFTRDGTGEYRISGTLASTFRFEPTFGGRSQQEGQQKAREASDRAAEVSGAGKNRFTRGSMQSQRSGPTRTDPDAGRKIATQAAESAEADMRSFEEMFAFGHELLLQRAERPADATGRVTTAEFFGLVPIQNRIDFFQESGGTGVLITLGLPSGDLKREGGAASPVGIFGRLQKVDEPSRIYQFSSTPDAAKIFSLQRVGGREHQLHEVRGVMSPGEYQVEFGVRAGDRFGAVSDRIEVPDFGGEKLQLSGPILSNQIGEQSSGDAGAGFSVGRLRLVPKLEPAFRPELEFGFYFQVYHAVPGSGDGRLHLDIEYGVCARRNGLFVPLGKPVSLADNPAPAHAFHIPLKGWGRGEYLLTVTVTDRTTGQVAVGSAPFLVQ